MRTRAKGRGGPGAAALAMGALAAVLLAAPAGAGEAAAAEPGVIRTSGEAVVRAAPDRAEIDLAVVTRAAEAEAAARENARRQRAVTEALREALGESAELRTAGYGLRPDYRHPEEGEAPEIAGYTATSHVRAATGRLERVGPAVDAAIGAGANRVSSLRFTLEDETERRAEALRLAARRARAKARALAGALGLEIARVRELAESGAPGVPVRERALQLEAAEAGPATPVLPGTLELRAEVTLTAEIAE